MARKVSTKARGRIGWVAIGILIGVVFSAFFPSCGAFLIEQPGKIGAAAEAYSK